MKNIYVLILSLLLLVSCTKSVEVDNNVILKEKTEILSHEILTNVSLLIGSELNIKLDECSEEEGYVACYSELSDMKQYLFMKDAFNSISKHNLIVGNEKLTIDEAKSFFNDVYKNHEEKWLSVFSQEEYMWKYYENAILLSKTIYPHGLNRYMFLSKKSANTAIDEAKKLYNNTDIIEKDTAILSNVRYEELWTYIKVSWNKYSNFKKTNKIFYVILWNFWWDIKIIEEYSETL